MNDSYNSFSSPVDSANGEPILPSTEYEERLDQDEVISEKIGPTSDETGYGPDTKGRSRGYDDLGAADHNMQTGQRVNALYRAEEEKLQSENQKFEDEWNAEYEENDRENKIHLALVGARNAINEANAHLDMMEAIIKEGQERAERVLSENKSATTTHTKNTPNEPTNTVPLSDAEASSNFTTAGSQPIDSAKEVRDINKSDAPAPESDMNTPQQDATLYRGKNGTVYSDPQQAIDSFKD